MCVWSNACTLEPKLQVMQKSFAAGFEVAVGPALEKLSALAQGADFLEMSAAMVDMFQNAVHAPEAPAPEVEEEPPTPVKKGKKAQ
jgi:hypothetical protein